MRSRTNGVDSGPDPLTRAVFMDPLRRSLQAGAFLPLESAAHRFSASSMSSSTRDVARLPLLPLLVPASEEFVDMILVSFRWIIPADLLAEEVMDDDDCLFPLLLLAVDRFARFTARSISFMSNPTRSSL
jgi:hypothetical protein